MAYIFCVPLEIVVILLLVTTQVGVASTFISLTPMLVVLAYKLYLMKVTSPQLVQARETNSLRFGLLNECIRSNYVLKWMGISDLMLERLQTYRKKEEKKLTLAAIAETTSIWSQVVLAPLMAQVACELHYYLF